MVSGGEYRFRSSENFTGGAKYIALRENKWKSPVNAVEISNSNVHGIEGAQYIIITHRNFYQQAQRLKEYRENSPKYPLSSVVVDVNEILMNSQAARKMYRLSGILLNMLMITGMPRPEYVLFFGDGDYDYRNIEGFNRNFIPAYHVYRADQFFRNLHQIFSYPTDDYYVRVAGNDVL
jgi:hypothetical protein